MDGLERQEPRTSRSRCRPGRTATAARTRTSSTSSRPATPRTSARSSTTPCPSFRVQDGLVEPRRVRRGRRQAKDQFVDWTWSQVTLGEEDAVYGIPQDAGPMALFYRADLFEAERHRRPDDLGGVRRRGREGPAAGGVHHQLLAERHQPVRRAGLAGRWPLVRQRRQTGGRSTSPTTKTKGRRLLAGPARPQAGLDRAAVDDRMGQRLQHRPGRGPGSSAVWGANSIASGAPDDRGQVGGRPDAAVERRRAASPATGAARRPPCSRARSTSYEAAQVRAVAEHLGRGADPAQQEGEPLPRHQGRRRAARAARGRRVLRRPEDLRRLR